MEIQVVFSIQTDEQAAVSSFVYLVRGVTFPYVSNEMLRERK